MTRTDLRLAKAAILTNTRSFAASAWPNMAMPKKTGVESKK